jgi:uncharacterized membrane protein YjgN (DUF898 family)
VNIVPSVGALRRPVRAVFSGKEGDLFRVLLRGSILQIPTFGFYRFWLITDVRRHLCAHTELAGDSFEYTGRGKELMVGFLIAMAVLVPVYIAYFLLALEAERLQAFASVPLFLILYVLGHYAFWRARRYRATRTVFRGVRFWMTGSGWAYVGRAVLWDILTVLTLGFAYPWRAAALEGYKMRHTRYGSVEGAFVGRGATLFKRGAWLWAMILVGAALAGVSFAAEQWALAILLTLALALGAPFLIPIYRAMELRWWLDGVRFGPVEVASDLRHGAIVWCYMKTMLVWLGYGMGAGIALGLVGAMAGGLVYVAGGTGAALPENLSIPAAVAGGIVSLVLYLAFLLGLDIIRRLFLDRGVWAAAAESATVANLEALDSVTGAGGPQSGSVGEGLLDALDMGGGF